MPIGISAPNPSGIPGFNIAGQWVRAGNAPGAINARALPGWYNVLRSVPVANGPVTLPPAYCGGEPVYVWNYSNEIDPVTGLPIGVPNTAMVFGNVMPDGQQDTVADAGGVQGVNGVAVPVNAVVMFWPTTPQSGWTNAWRPGAWQFKLLA